MIGFIGSPYSFEGFGGTAAIWTACIAVYALRIIRTRRGADADKAVAEKPSIAIFLFDAFIAGFIWFKFIFEMVSVFVIARACTAKHLTFVNFSKLIVHAFEYGFSVFGTGENAFCTIQAFIIFATALTLDFLVSMVVFAYFKGIAVTSFIACV